jgi:hypothetical protein
LFEVKIKNKPDTFFPKYFSDELGGVSVAGGYFFLSGLIEMTLKFFCLFSYSSFFLLHTCTSTLRPLNSLHFNCALSFTHFGKKLV